MYYFFGASLNCYAALRFFGKENVIAIIDNNDRKVGTLYEGIGVISFDDFLSKWTGETVIITAFTASREIVSQLEANNVNNYFECPYIGAGFFSCQEMIEMWNLTQYDSFAILFGNPISDTLMAELKKVNSNCSFKNILHINAGCCAVSDVIINMKENSDLDELLCGNCKVINFWSDIAHKAESRYLPLLKYKNIHMGEKCFLIGNGPSLLPSDLDKIASHDMISIGCNRIYLMFPNTHWKPDYYVVIDENMYREVTEEISNCDFTVFVKDFFGIDIKKDNGSANVFRMFDKRYQSGYPDFSDDFSNGVYAGRTVMYVMLQMAVYMGFKEIYLLGVDFSWGEDGKDTHFCKNYMDDNIVRDFMKYKGETYNAYIAAKRYADVYNIKIYNATRGGHLDVFERVNFEEIFDTNKNKR